MADEDENDPTAKGDPAAEGKQDPAPESDVDPVSDTETWLAAQPKDVQIAFTAKHGNLLKAIKDERADKSADKGAAKKLKALEEQLAEKAKAEMSEIDRLKLENAEKDKAIETERAKTAKFEAEKAFNAAVAKLKIVFVNDTAKEDAFARMDITTPDGFEKAIKQLVIDRPYLLKTVTVPDLDAEKNGKKEKKGELTPERQAEIEQRYRIR